MKSLLRPNRNFLWLVWVVGLVGHAQNIEDFSGKVVSDSFDISGIHVVNKNSPEMQTDYLNGNHPFVLEGMTQFASTQTKE